MPTETAKPVKKITQKEYDRLSKKLDKAEENLDLVNAARKKAFREFEAKQDAEYKAFTKEHDKLYRKAHNAWKRALENYVNTPISSVADGFNEILKR